MKQSYTEKEFNEILEKTESRRGWDFSRMRTTSSPPWDYITVIKSYIKPTSKVLDIGTGGGEKFLQLARYFKTGVAIDSDPEMVRAAANNGSGINNTSFLTNNDSLDGLDTDFNIIINRHAPFRLEAVEKHLVHGGYFITQQVGERNMLNIKRALNLPILQPPIDSIIISANDLKTIEVKEYNIEYIVKDIESLVFWLNALDLLHADIDGSQSVKDVEALNKILKGNVAQKGFATNEQRYLAIAQK